MATPTDPHERFREADAAMQRMIDAERDTRGLRTRIEDALHTYRIAHGSDPPHIILSRRQRDELVTIDQEIAREAGDRPCHPDRVWTYRGPTGTIHSIVTPGVNAVAVDEEKPHGD